MVLGEVSGASPRTLLLYNHYDVVPPDPLGDWTNPPFSPQVRDGRIFARGTADNKGDLIARLMEGQEEIGSPHLREFVEANKELVAAHACIGEGGSRNTQGHPEVTLGIRGRANIQVEVRGAKQSFHSSLTSVIPNPTWDLVWALAGLKDRNERVLIDGFYEEALRPTPEELTCLDRIAFDEEGTLAQLGLPAFTLGVRGCDLMRRLLFEPTCEVAAFGAGEWLDKLQGIPRRAVATVRFGLVPNQDPEKVTELLRRHLDRLGFREVALTLQSWRYPGRTPLRDPLAQTVIGAAQKVYGVEPVIYPVSPTLGGTPIHELAEPLGIPSASLGVSSPQSQMHGPDECIRLEDFALGIKAMAQLIHDFAAIGGTHHD
jgi:acetylornithine deacetylase/succinyl-diaminopimelate desuccinylase-like protein